MYSLVIVYLLATGDVKISTPLIYPSKDACMAWVGYAQGTGDAKINGNGRALVFCVETAVAQAQGN